MSPARTRRAARPGPARRPNLLARLGVAGIDYKDTGTLRLFLTDRGRIRSRQVTGLTVGQQRRVAAAVKNAREMALLPYPTARAGGPGRSVPAQNSQSASSVTRCRPTT